MAVVVHSEGTGITFRSVTVMKIYLATWIAEKDQQMSLTKVGYTQRLLSYFFIKEQKIDKKTFVKYCRKTTE